MFTHVFTNLFTLMSQRFTLIQSCLVFYHTITSKNCSDSNLKIPVDLDPIRIMESRFWRNGLPEFLDPNWPPHDSVFLRVEQGSFQWFKTKEAENVTNCVRCHNQICGTDSCRCLNCLPMKTGKSFSTLPSFSYNWPVLMKNLPLLAPAHLESLLNWRNITMAVRSIARFNLIAGRDPEGVEYPCEMVW